MTRQHQEEPEISTAAGPADGRHHCDSCARNPGMIDKSRASLDRAISAGNVALAESLARQLAAHRGGCVT